MPTCIAIIHATRAAVQPIEASFDALWPEAETIGLLDETLSRDLSKAGELTPEIYGRIKRLAEFGENGGADAILYSCASFGGAIEAARADMDIPVLKPNEAMLEEALDAGANIRLVATFKPAIPSMVKELEEMAVERKRKIVIDSCFVAGAFDALDRNQFERHDTLIAEAVSDRPPCDVVVLAQFSMARALPTVSGMVEYKVLSSPNSAVARLRRGLAE